MPNFWEKLDQDLQVIYRNYLDIREKGEAGVDRVHPALRAGFELSLRLRYTGRLEDLKEDLELQVLSEQSSDACLIQLHLSDLERVARDERVKGLSYKPGKKLDPRTRLLLQRLRARKSRSLEAGPDAAPAIDSIGALIKFEGPVDTLTGLGCKVSRVLGNIASVTIPIDKLEAVANHPNVLRIESNRAYYPELDESIEEIKADTLRNDSPPFGGAGKFTGKGVIVGIIDFGFQFAHKVFRDPSDPSKSRILYLYDQSLTAQSGETVPNDSLGNPMIGVEYDKSDIEAAMSAADPSTIVRHEPDSHGTHVAGIAAGNGAQSGNCHGAYHYVGVAPEADLIFVRLSSGSRQLGTSNNLIDAIGYIVDKADAEDKPAVINMSLGDNLGAHDGSSLVEEMLDLYLTILNPVKGFTIIKSSGNEGNKKRHAHDDVPANNTAAPLELKFQVTPADDDESSYIEIDIWYPDMHNLDIEIVPPGNNITGTNTASPGDNNSFNEDTNNSTVSIDSSTGEPNGQKRIFIELDPNGDDPNLPGEWVLKLSNAGGDPFPFNAWIERNQAATFTTFVKKERTISIPGTSQEVITVGNYLVKGKDEGKLSASSSRGPTSDGRTKPEVAAPGTDIVSARYDPDAGSCCDCCYDFYTSMSGTSMAAPHVAGAVALMLEKDPLLSHADIKTALMTTARDDGFTGTTPNNRFGEGKLDVAAAVGAVSTSDRAITGAVTNEVSSHRAITAQPHFTEDSPLGRFIRTPQGRTLHQLMLRHYDQVRKLINHNKRVATIWHRNQGPLLAHHVIRCSMLPHVQLPGELDGTPVSEYLDHIAAALRKHGDEDLRRALDEAVPLARQLPGKSFHQAVALLEGAPATSNE